MHEFLDCRNMKNFKNSLPNELPILASVKEKKNTSKSCFLVFFSFSFCFLYFLVESKWNRWNHMSFFPLIYITSATTMTRLKKKNRKKTFLFKDTVFLDEPLFQIEAVAVFQLLSCGDFPRDRCDSRVLRSQFTTLTLKAAEFYLYKSGLFNAFILFIYFLKKQHDYNKYITH